MTSVDIEEDSGSEDEMPADQKEMKEYEPTTWEIMKLCEPEKYLMAIGIIAAIAVGSSFPAFAILFGETYGVSILIYVKPLRSNF